MERSRNPPLQEQAPGPLSTLEAQVERVTYVAEETGYTVARASAPGFREPVTIVGYFPGLAPGEVLHMEGAWENHPKFGRQFKAAVHRAVVPATADGIRKYLGSGLIRGIGPVMASRIVKKFGDRTLEIIDGSIERLAEIDGIGPKRVGLIRKAWEEQKEIRAIMIFLQGHGVGLGHAAKIYKQYGQRSVSMVTQNPYRLATDIRGIGFQTADRIAAKLGFQKSAPVRVEAGILYVLEQLSGEGHVYYPHDALVDACRKILALDREAVVRGLGGLSADRRIVVEAPDGPPDGHAAEREAVYLARLHACEAGIAAHVARLASSEKSVRRMDPGKAVEWVQKRIRIRLAQMQTQAVAGAIREKILVVTGGPGTGKTTLVRAIIDVYRAAGARIELAAPTGRAAKRMAEAAGRGARTIHRMLEFSWQSGGFQRNERRPLEADIVIVDEASMIDTPLMYHLLRALPSGVTLILVGDSSQLPSVGPGNILGDVIASGSIPVVTLREVFRQAQESLIIVNAHRINRGLLPRAVASRGAPGDFYFIEQEDPDSAFRVVMQLVCERIPRRLGVDPKTDIQVLSPMHKGVLGTLHLNAALQERLNPSAREIPRGDRRFRVGDKVMQIRNNYEKEVFNGDIGIIATLDPERQELAVAYDDRSVAYEFTELDEITMAYAITVHKSQGSEYPVAVLPVLSEHHLLLQRNLIYTALTRGKRLVVLVGSRKALAMGIRNDRPAKRHTLLARRLRSLR